MIRVTGIDGKACWLDPRKIVGIFPFTAEKPTPGVIMATKGSMILMDVDGVGPVHLSDMPDAVAALMGFHPDTPN